MEYLADRRDRLDISTGLPARGRPCVLVVDDEQAFCSALSEILTLFGCDVTEAHSARSADSVLNEARPDLILTDVMMPEIDGLTFIRRLRSNPASRHIPTIAVSAKTMPEDIDAARIAGADAYLKKPFTMQELKAAISPYLGR